MPVHAKTRSKICKIKEKFKNVTRTGGARKAPADGRAPPRSCYVFDVFGFFFGVQEGPGGSRDVQLSIFHLGTYRFYNGVTCIKDLGPCFGMNGHPRRDTDVILRLSKSTIEYLSYYIGFAMELIVKMIVFDETMTFVRFVMMFCFF